MVVFRRDADGRYIQIGCMVAAYNISALPVNRFFIIDIEKYARDKGTENNYEPPEPVDVLISAWFARKKI